MIEQKHDDLKSAQAEMGEVKEENQRLKTSLNQIMKDYESLKSQFQAGIVGRQTSIKLPQQQHHNNNNTNDEFLEDQTELVSLTLGRFPTPAAEKKKLASAADQNHQLNENLSLGLNCKFEQDHRSTAVVVVKESDSSNRSLTNSFDHETKEDAGETTWPPSKRAKTTRSGGGEDDVATPQNPPKRARVCVRARCETTTVSNKSFVSIMLHSHLLVLSFVFV